MTAYGRATIADLAQAAGVSISTVDRVLNGRDPVRQVTADKVLEAAERIGFRGVVALRQRVAHSRHVGRLGFLLQRRGQEEYRLWGDLLDQATRASMVIQGQPVVRFLDDLSPDSVVEALIALSREVDAVALVAADHPRINHAVDLLAGDGIPVFTLITDLSAQGVAGHVGIDDLRKGRTAAWFVHRLASRLERIALLVGSARYMSQDLAEAGFRGYFREHLPDCRLIEASPTLEENDLAFAITLKLLRDEADLGGFYVAGGGVGGVIAALRQHEGPRPVVVVNELTDETRAALADGVIDVVLSHPSAEMAVKAVDVIARAIAAPGGSGRKVHYLPFAIHTSENS